MCFTALYGLFKKLSPPKPYPTIRYQKQAENKPNTVNVIILFSMLIPLIICKKGRHLLRHLSSLLQPYEVLITLFKCLCAIIRAHSYLNFAWLLLKSDWFFSFIIAIQTSRSVCSIFNNCFDMFFYNKHSFLSIYL